jgi:ParB-like chromosome segregation protein Spo0J
MEIRSWPIGDIAPYEFNNRKHDDLQIDRIANSIKEFGFNQPIVVDESSVILVGHGRLLAARKLGLKEVPVYQIKGLSEVQKKAYRILDNKLQNDSTWNFNNLELELGFLEDNGLDFGEWGLSELFSSEDDVVSREVTDAEIKAAPEFAWCLVGLPLERGGELDAAIRGVKVEGLIIHYGVGSGSD